MHEQRTNSRANLPKKRLVGRVVAATALALASIPASAVSLAWTGEEAEVAGDPEATHEGVFAENAYPSATTCAPCHPKHFRQWSISQHAYAQMSPVFNAMNGKILELTNGTNGDFCIRCHTPVGMNLGEPEFMSNIDRHPTSREGVTCIACHRVNGSPYGKLSGRLAIEQGDLAGPIYGPSGDTEELDRIISAAGLVTDPTDTSGRKVHGRVEPFFQMTTPAHCGTCHDVTLVNGFRLEEAFSEYKKAPAAKLGVTCQDCHMGLEPGVILADRDDPDFERKNYDYGPAAKVGSFETAPRRLTNHMFVGPDYSVLSPALFPFNVDAIKEESQKDDPSAQGYATIREWLEFDHKAGWGTKQENVPEGFEFPERWARRTDRRRAARIIKRNQELLDEITELRLKLLQNGYKLGEIEVLRAEPDGIKFRTEIRSGTNGHNVPTGFDAERLVWLFVQVRDAEGTLVKQSGDLDPNGDLRDLHSRYVHNHELPLDKELLSLQSRFLTRMVRGGEREQVLAVNYSPSPLPFLRPAVQSNVLLGRPGGARKHKMGIEPGGRRRATYTVKRKQLTGKPPYTVTVQLKAAMVPVNLLNEIRDVGFDYNMSARDVAENLVAGHQVVWQREVTIDMHPAGATEGE